MTKLIASALHKANVRYLDDVIEIAFTDQKGRQSSVELPLKEAVRLVTAATQGAISLALREGQPVKGSGWEHLTFIQPGKLDVEVLPLLDPPEIALMVDRGSERQVPIRLSQDTAKGLALRLLEKIEQCSDRDRDQQLN